MTAAQLARAYQQGDPLTPAQTSKARRYLRRTTKHAAYQLACAVSTANAARVAVIASRIAA